MSVHRYGKFKVTNKATGEVHYLTADELARVPAKAAHGRAGKGKVIEIRNIPEKGYTQFGVHHARAPMHGHHVDIRPNVSIRLFGLDTNKVKGPQPYDITFKVGDLAIYGSYNFDYTGTIVSIGAKVVTVKEEHGSRLHKMTIARFSTYNHDYDAERIMQRRMNWSD